MTSGSRWKNDPSDRLLKEKNRMRRIGRIYAFATENRINFIFFILSILLVLYIYGSVGMTAS
jgi:hypothetical protein